MGSLHIWKGTINADSYIQVLEQHMLPSRRCLFQGRPCIFQHDNARPHTASITMSWLHRRRIRVLKWPACRSFTHRKHLAHHKEEGATKKT
uniref:Tc1-like transposase DDE domain-containing protein n=1 Tax=Esox lucius TaxID=8010 RepID=A0AAY5KXH5_ESOLU